MSGHPTFIGASALHYPHWMGPVYPETLDRRELLPSYALLPFNNP